MSDGEPLIETVTLGQAQALLACAAHEQSFLILSPPGVGKSDMVAQAAAAAGLECKSLLGTQIAPEDVTGVPFIAGERSVFCPPRVLLPEDPRPFCLFLDELPACTPDIQKAFYSLLLERRLGEHKLPGGTWVVAAGNRAEDRALVRTISSALVNRVVILHVRVDLGEWLAWAAAAGVRRDVMTFVRHDPPALLREVPAAPAPFSTPRAWAALSRALDRAQAAGVLDDETCRALVAGRVSPSDARGFCHWWRMIRAVFLVAGCAASDDVAARGLPSILNLVLREQPIAQRLADALSAADILTIGHLAAQTREDIRRLPGCDALHVEEAENLLGRFGMTLGMNF
jgi:hypothetical protein